MKLAAKRLATTSSSEASVWRRAAFFELRSKALLIFESADEAVRCAIDEAFGAKFKDVKQVRAAVSARAAREREAAPELSSGRDGAAREGSARGCCARRRPSVGRAATRRRRPRRAFVGRGRLRGEGGLGVGAACG